MSQENVEIVRRVLDGVSRSDRASVEPLLHPDVEWRTVLGPLLGVETVSGHEAVLRLGFEEIPDAFEDYHAEVEEMMDLGEAGVLVVARYVVRGKKSGIEIDEQISSVHLLRDGMIVSVRDYPSRQEALEAAGLRE
ncbi:MAG: nuclear transport factor 2 family protein [Actinomycetota bacterium]